MMVQQVFNNCHFSCPAWNDVPILAMFGLMLPQPSRWSDMVRYGHMIPGSGAAWRRGPLEPLRRPGGSWEGLGATVEDCSGGVHPGPAWSP